MIFYADFNHCLNRDPLARAIWIKQAGLNQKNHIAPDKPGLELNQNVQVWKLSLQRYSRAVKIFLVVSLPPVPVRW